MKPFMSSLRFREESHATRSREAAVVGGRHWSPVRIGSLRCNKINSQRDTVGGRGCGSRSHADYVSDQGNRVRARLARSERTYLAHCGGSPIVQQADGTLFDSFKGVADHFYTKKILPVILSLGISILLRVDKTQTWRATIDLHYNSERKR